MAVPWMTVLRAVPWSDVVKNAPRAVNGAKDLWNKVSSKSTRTSGPAGADVVATGPSGETPSLASLATRVAETEAAMETLRDQLRESSRLIESLAEQNAQLVQQIDANRMRLRRVAIGTCLAILTAAGAVLLSLQP